MAIDLVFNPTDSPFHLVLNKDSNRLIVRDKAAPLSPYETCSLGRIVEHLHKIEKIRVDNLASLEHKDEVIQLINRCITKHNHSALKTFLKILVIPWLFAALFNLDFLKNYKRIDENFFSEVDFKTFDYTSFDKALDLIQSGTQVHKLVFSKKIFNNEKIFSAFRGNSSLNQVSFAYLDVNSEVVGKACEVLRTLPNLQSLSFIGTSIKGEGRALSALVDNNRSLRHLDLESTSLTDEELLPISEALATNTTLLKLHLNNNYIKSNGAHYLAEMLKRNSTLEHLDLGGNLITDNDLTGVRNLAETLKTHPALSYLNLKSNGLTDEGVIPFAKMLAANHSIKHFDVSYNGLGQARASEAFEDSFKVNNTLEHFSIFWNNLSLTDVSHLAAGLSENYSIKYFDIAANDITEGKLAYLRNVFVNNAFPREIRWSSSEPYKQFFASLLIIPMIPFLMLFGWNPSKAGTISN